MPDALAKCTHCGFVHSVLHCDVGEGQAYDMARRIYADTLPQVLVDSDVEDAREWLDAPAGMLPRIMAAIDARGRIIITGGGGAGGGPWGFGGGGGSHPMPQAQPVALESDQVDDTSPFEIDFKRAQAYFLAQKFSW
jgi:hypothetical protein